LLAALAVAIFAYSAFEAYNIRIENIRIYTDKLPPGVNRIRVVQISDLHLGLFHRSGKSKRVAKLVNAQKPDIFVSTGDLVDGKFEQIMGLPEEIFRGIDAPLGQFAITGNHEYYSGISDAFAFMQNAGFTILNNKAVIAGGAVRIIGMSDSGLKSTTPFEGRLEAKLLENGAEELFTILLKHRPEINPASAGKFDLQLSGHTHQGQIFPFLYLTRLAYPYSGGTYALPGGGMLHVNRGTGTWGPPIRFLAPPEITVIDIVSRQ
jgi:predicted MPP superfamily phosphohydrolase